MSNLGRFNRWFIAQVVDVLIIAYIRKESAFAGRPVAIVGSAAGSVVVVGHALAISKSTSAWQGSDSLHQQAKFFPFNSFLIS